MEKEKKKWETPKLICLYRGRPEEAVLAACKLSTASTGPGNFKGTCDETGYKDCSSNVGT